MNKEEITMDNVTEDDLARSVLIDRADIDAPTILYKYRDWSDRRHKSILVERTVFLAPPSSFHDEMEFRNFKRYDLMTDDEIYKQYLVFSYNDPDHANYSDEEHIADAVEWTQKAPFKDPIYLVERQTRNYEELDRRIGILSLTDRKDNIDIWNSYAHRGKGFCVGFDRQLLFESINGGGKVRYPEKLPTILGTDSYSMERWKQIFNKEKKWEFEEEYRTQIFDKNGLREVDRCRILPKECIKEIVFGWDIAEDHINKIKNVCRSGGLCPEFFQAKIENSNVVIFSDALDK